jgi:putative ABC transport system substrate-binding protein
MIEWRWQHIDTRTRNMRAFRVSHDDEAKVMMRRRDFIAGLAGAAAARPVAAFAQPAMPVVGVLSSAPFDSRKDQLAAFYRGLQEAGFVQGQNVAFEFRSAENQFSRLPALAAELVERRVDVIATITGDISAVAARAATTTIPVVFVVGGDPVQRGLVASLNRPGGNLTGISFLVVATGAKRLQLLTELIPAASRIGFLVNSENPNADLSIRDAEGAAHVLGKNLVVAKVTTDTDIAGEFASFEKTVEGVAIDPDPFFLAKREQLVELADRTKLPSIYPFREFAAVGGLMSYGASLSNAYREVGIYVGKILKGDKPADLPVTQSAKFEFVINLKTARSLGIDVPATQLVLADEVIE